VTFEKVLPQAERALPSLLLRLRFSHHRGRSRVRARQGTGMTRLLITTVSTVALCAGAAHAQGVPTDETTLLERISVTANRTPTETGKVGSTISVVTEEEIEQKSFVTATDYLTGLPGISFAQNGGLGSTSSLYVRGLPGGYVKTFHNGIDVSDTTGIQVQTAYEYLLTAGVRGIEVLKGSQSTLYGSNAIAGVVDLNTLGDIEEGLHHTVQVEGGSRGTVLGRYGFAGAKDGSRIAADVTGLRTDGISHWAAGSERDGYENLTLDIAGEHRVSDVLTVFGSGLYIDAEGDFDDFGADSSFNETLTTIMAGRAGLTVALLDGRWLNMFSAQAFKMDRDSVENPLTSNFTGTRQKLDYEASFEATDRLLIQYGADHERQVADTETPDYSTFPPVDLVNARSDMTLSSAWTQAVYEPVDDLVATIGLRHDEHSDFGGATTYRGTISYLFPGTSTRLHSSLGTGFRAPSLYQLFDPTYGNTTLTPETSVSFDIGVEQAFLEDRLSIGATYFHIDVNDLIGFGSFGYEQVPGRTESQGLEARFSYQFTNALALAGSYTYTDSRQPSGARSNRVPEHVTTLSAIYTPAEKWTVSGDVRFVADTLESNTPLDDYVLVNAKVAYQVTDSAEVYLRGENLLNQDYQTARGYNTPGFGAFAGFKAKF
jgi:vitamin B12 transporter